eukprot:gb/GECG01012303.1/.p1 GENE.gb/GECG01012303.1/~~gb/GECG01012303.1/.p1  ORF type:complete len:194 (+),score=9.81 gb/GECG01012303.1/:1-582(+)
MKRMSRRVSRSDTMLICVFTGIIALVFSIAAITNRHWAHIAGWSHQGLWEECGVVGCSTLKGSDSSAPYLTLTRIFITLGAFASVAILATSSVGKFLKRSAHPWPQLTFFAVLSYFCFNFVGMIAFQRYLALDSPGWLYVDAGITPAILGIALSCATACLLLWKFRVSGVCGNGAPTEDSVLLDEQELNEEQV